MRAAWEIADYMPPGAWLVPMLRAMTETNLVYLRSTENVPELYRSGVVYKHDPPGKEIWRDIPTILQCGWGDCKKLSCWRAAELQFRGIQATALPVVQTTRHGVVLVHVIVEWANGTTEDPSKRLGMLGNGLDDIGRC